jgi:hypothetical protein
MLEEVLFMLLGLYNYTADTRRIYLGLQLFLMNDPGIKSGSQDL